MHRLVFWMIMAGLFGALSPVAWGENTNVFELQDGDRVVLAGDILIEGEQRYGFIEYLLTTRYPDRNITFRNLGWRTDQPDGQPRQKFDWANPPEDWIGQLVSQLQTAKPTVLFLGYGTAASAAGQTGLAGFKRWMTQLLDALRKMNPQVRLVFFSPTRYGRTAPQTADTEPRNRQLALFTQAIREMADRHEAHFVSFFRQLNNDFFLNPGPPMTEDGVRLNEYGYRRAAEVVAQTFLWDPNSWQIGITEQGRQRQGSYGAVVRELDRKEDRVRLVTIDEILVPPPWDGATDSAPFATPDCRIQFQGMKPGKYQLKIDGEMVETKDAALLGQSGVRIEKGPQFEQAKQLLHWIRTKNELLLQSPLPLAASSPGSHPSGEAKTDEREQAKSNSPLLDAEKKIALLKKPLPHTFELVPVPAD